MFAAQFNDWGNKEDTYLAAWKRLSGELRKLQNTVKRRESQL